MTRKLYLAAFLVLAFAASDATTRTRSKIEMVYQSRPNGDFRIYLFGNEGQVQCSAGNVHIAQPSDGLNPLVIECKH